MGFDDKIFTDCKHMILYFSEFLSELLILRVSYPVTLSIEDVDVQKR